MSRNKDVNKRTSKFYLKEYENAKDIYLEYKFSSGVIDVTEKLNGNMLENLINLKQTTQKLIEIRNSILNFYTKSKQEVTKSEDYLQYTKEDMIKIREAAKRIEEHGFLNNHYIWDIPKKSDEKELYEGGEMSE
mmetsp:Transcript_16754/g.18628  ORF Transcript_16754/g.18628 Transcript_16754/m.18628 type:complete len:134 (+) Transcript_16754:407-808(+)